MSDPTFPLLDLMHATEDLGIGEREYVDFIASLRRYRRSSVLFEATAAGMWGWNSSEKAQSLAERELPHLVRACAGRIAALAAAVTFEPTARRLASREEFEMLVHEFVSIRDVVSDPPFLAAETAQLHSALASSEIFRDPFADPARVRHATSILCFARAMRPQWEARGVHLEDVPRVWWTLAALDRAYGTNARLKAALMMEPRDYLRAGFLLLTMATTNGGQINLAKSTLDPALADALHLDLDAVRLVANRMSRCCLGLREWHREMLRTTAGPYRRYAPHPLLDAPLIRLDRSFFGPTDDTSQFLCPSPDHLLEHLRVTCFEAVRQLPPHSLLKNPRTALGPVLEEYLHAMLAAVGAENVLRLTPDPARPGLIADFFVAAGTYGLVLESKRSLGHPLDKSLLAPEGAVRIWTKLYEAYSQLAATRQRKPWKADPRFAHIDQVVSIVVTDDVLVADGHAFTHLALVTGMLGALGLDDVEPLSVSDLEEALLAFGPVRLAELIHEKWASGKAVDLFHSVVELPPGRPPFARRTHLLEADRELFGDLGLAHIEARRGRAAKRPSAV